MALQFFNTLSRSVQEFVPLDPNRKHVGMYCCGPTIHDFAHIGNFRTFVFADLLRRYLEFRGYDVKHVMNITDVEDKIIKRVREAGTTLREYTGKYEAAFLEDLKTLNCKTPSVTPRATEYIPQIVSLIEKLIARGIAYQAADGSVYFSIDKYRSCGCKYGQLVNLNFEGMRVGERVASDEYEKESLADFALWKARVPDDGAVFWPSPWGEGRPGWHIECSAMSMDVLGTSFDIHAGGEDLMFPHHEDEIAQSEGATGKPFVKYWLHGSHLLVEGKKMSKSLGNFFTLRDLLGKGFNGREIRCLMVSAHYREQFNFTLEGLAGSRTALARITECLNKLCEYCDETTGTMTGKVNQVVIEKFTSALDNDLNVSQAWAVVFDWIREINRIISQGQMTAGSAIDALATWKHLDSVLGLGVEPRSATRIRQVDGITPGGTLVDVLGESDAPSEVIHLLMQRVEAKKAKDFKRSDSIRDELKAKGWVIEDTPKGPRLKKI